MRGPSTKNLTLLQDILLNLWMMGETPPRPASLSSLRDCDHLVINWIKHHGHPDFRPPLSPCTEHVESSVDLIPQLPSLAPSTVCRCRHAVWLRAELARVKKVEICFCLPRLSWFVCVCNVGVDPGLVLLHKGALVVPWLVVEEVRSLAANEAALHTLQQPGRFQLQLDIWIFSHVEGHLFRFVFLSPQSGALGRGFHTHPSTYSFWAFRPVCTKAFRGCDYKFKIGELRILISENTFAGHWET